MEKMDYDRIDVCESDGDEPAPSGRDEQSGPSCFDERPGPSSRDDQTEAAGRDDPPRSGMNSSDSSCFDVWRRFRSSLTFNTEPSQEQAGRSPSVVPKKHKKKVFMGGVMGAKDPIALLATNPPKSILKKVDGIKPSISNIIKTVRFKAIPVVVGKGKKQKKKE